MTLSPEAFEALKQLLLAGAGALIFWLKTIQGKRKRLQSTERRATNVTLTGVELFKDMLNELRQGMKKDMDTSVVSNVGGLCKDLRGVGADVKLKLEDMSSRVETERKEARGMRALTGDVAKELRDQIIMNRTAIHKLSDKVDTLLVEWGVANGKKNGKHA